MGPCIEISHAGHRAVVARSGATLRSYELDGRPVIEAFDGPGTPPVGCQGQVLAPWPNRVVDGRWAWRGQPHQLEITEPERGHALHGLVRTLTWDVTGHRSGAVELEVALPVHPGWPFPLRVRAGYRLGDDGLTATVTAINVGQESCPYGTAAHPYLALGGGMVDDAVLCLPAATWLETDERLAPTGRRPTAGSAYELSGERPIAGRRIDTAYTDLPRAADGRVEARLTVPGGRTTLIWGDGAVRWWQVFTGDTLPDRWRRRALAVEPMTCAPDALNSHDGLIILEPGTTTSMTWGVIPG